MSQFSKWFFYNRKSDNWIRSNATIMWQNYSEGIALCFTVNSRKLSWIATFGIELKAIEIYYVMMKLIR